MKGLREAFLGRFNASLRRYALKQSGLGLDAVEKRIGRLFSLDPRDLYGQSRARHIAQARGMFCFWAVRELGISQKTLADLFCVTEPAITYAVRRGEKTAREKGHRLREEEEADRDA